MSTGGQQRDEYMEPGDHPIDPRAVAVYCASSMGNQKAYQAAATSLGKALAATKRPLVYGGGQNGLMGLVAGAVLDNGGDVTGVVPYAFVASGGEGDKTKKSGAFEGGARVMAQRQSESVRTIVVNSMHERKVEMTRRSCGFVALPGGFGTWEEVMEAVTWNQIGIQSKPIVLLNILGYYAPLSTLIRSGIDTGFIAPQNEHLLVFVDGPSSDPEENAAFDWGAAALAALEGWAPPADQHFSFDWTLQKPGASGESRTQGALNAT